MQALPLVCLLALSRSIHDANSCKVVGRSSTRVSRLPSFQSHIVMAYPLPGMVVMQHQSSPICIRSCLHYCKLAAFSPSSLDDK